MSPSQVLYSCRQTNTKPDITAFEGVPPGSLSDNAFLAN